MEKRKYTGACLFCGQVYDTDVEFNSQEEADQNATMMCTCSSAKLMQKLEASRSAAYQNIDQLFDQGCEKVCGLPACSETVIVFLKQAVDLVSHSHIDGISVNLGSDGRAKISVTGKGNIKVSRSQSVTATLEA